MDKLKELDAVAYVRFASVYREFKDIDTFMGRIEENGRIKKSCRLRHYPEIFIHFSANLSSTL